MQIRDEAGNPVEYMRSWESGAKKPKRGGGNLGRRIGDDPVVPRRPTGASNEGVRLPKPRRTVERTSRIGPPRGELRTVDDEIRRNWDAIPEEQRADIELLVAEQRLDRAEVKERLLIFLEAAKRAPELRKRGLSWYRDVRNDIDRRAKRLNVSRAAFAAVLGATSPRQTWEHDNKDINDPARFPNHLLAEQVIKMWNANPELEITEEFAEAWFMAARGAVDIRDLVGQTHRLQDLSPDLASKLAQYYGLGRIPGVGTVMTERIANALEALHAEKRGLDPGMVLSGNKTYAFYRALMDDEYHNAVIDVWMIQAATGRATSGKDESGKNLKIPVRNSQIGYIAHGALDLGRPTKTEIDKKGFNPQGAIYHWIADVVNEIAAEQDPPMKISDVQALIWYAIKNGGGFSLLPDRLKENPNVIATDIADSD